MRGWGGEIRFSKSNKKKTDLYVSKLCSCVRDLDPGIYVEIRKRFSFGGGGGKFATVFEVSSIISRVGDRIIASIDVRVETD